MVISMTSKTTKTILLAVMLSAIVVPLTIIGSADAADNAGRTIIDTSVPVKVNHNLEQLAVLDQAFENAESDGERESIKQEALKLMKSKPIRSSSDIEKQIRYLGVQEVLTDSITSMPQVDGKYAIPFTRIGYDESVEMLHVRIHEDYATQENMQNYEKTIRSFIGNDIDLKLSNGGAPNWQFTTCSSGPLADCDPLESGVEFEATNHSGCTIGMRATYDGDDGFVTAGHCLDGETDSDVGQDSISSVIGTVSKETFNLGSSYETCDCGFVEIDSGSRSMDADVYWDSYYPTSAADPSDTDYVKGYGKSGKTYGYVDGTCEDVPVGNNPTTTLICVIVVDNAAPMGDSGGMWVQTFDSTPEFHGIQSASDSVNDETAIVKHSKFTTHFSGLSWDY